MNSSTSGQPEDLGALTLRITQFLYHEAWLLDSGQLQAWVELFSDDGMYWIPSSPTQTDRLNQVSIVLEDKALLQVRMQRLCHEDAHAVTPMPATVHTVSNVNLLDGRSDSEFGYVVRSVVTMHEQRGDIARTLSAYATHTLLSNDDEFKIAQKRVDLIQCGTAFAPISVLL
jgi:3-phenylpropionate/cinnamic acid dioxygenase small subunit